MIARLVANRRRLAWVAALSIAVLWLGCGVALAKYRGTDVLGNLAPTSLLKHGSLADRYPLSAYGLDYHVDVGVTALDGVPPTIAHWAAAQLWSVSSFMARTVIDVFCWAFSLDLLGGSTGQPGAIGPVAAAVSSVYENVIGEAWLVVAITLAGLWGIWKALVQRRYSQTAAALATSVVFVLVALFFVYEPAETIGTGARWANTLSLAFLSGANRGTVDDPGAAKQRVADELFAAQIVQPWLALEFGGRRHCVNPHDTDKDDFPRPVSVNDPHADVCRDSLTAGKDGHGGYAPRFWRYAVGSDERDAEYEALKNGQAPAGDPQFRGYQVDKADAPAVDIQQAGGAFQRLTLAIVIFIGSLGMVCLLGFLSLAVVLAQVVALVLLAFAPVALVVGVFPGVGHDVFRGWLARLATAVFIKALYSLVIAVVVAVAAALGQATGDLGFLFAFGLQAVFYWALFLYRRQISQRLVAATSGGRGYDERPVMGLAHRGAGIAAHPLGALTSLPHRHGSQRQESALAITCAAPATAGGSADRGDDPGGTATTARPGGDPPPCPSPAAASEHDHPAHEFTSQRHAVAIVAPVNGRGPARAEEPHANTAAHETGAALDHEDGTTGTTEGAGSQDVMRGARQLRERQGQTRNSTDEGWVA